ncbi:unnamed protein product [Adineta steineri]|uniref:Uncharacterized protein n=1 Tax=Adineta steineri TaxID=433720 RepID=A0A815IG58_9BILA|nr:unnamed protein product [Adineta steineri]CAF3706036.1 unnamed protein product [Adineta steineri]
MTGSMNFARGYHTASILPNGLVLVVGGTNSSGVYFNSTELYNPSTSTWTTTGSMNAGRDIHTASALANGKVLVAGGYGNGSYLTSAELY